MNHKKIQRLWREEGLRVPQRRRRKRLGCSTAPHVAKAEAPNMVWAVDFQFVARELPRDERDALFDKLVELAPVFGDYQAKTSRVIPLFELQKA